MDTAIDSQTDIPLRRRGTCGNRGTDTAVQASARDRGRRELRRESRPSRSASWRAKDFDVGLNNPWYVEEMIKLGLVIPDIHVPFGRVPLTIGAAGPEPRGDRQFAGGRAQASDRTRISIAYTSTGTSGKTFLRAIEIMGLQDQYPRSPASDGGRRAADRCRERSSAVRHCPALEDHRRSRRRAGRDLPAGTWS